MGPGKDTHGTLVPSKRGGRGWPTATAQRAKCRTHQRVQNTGLPKNKQSDEIYGVKTINWEDSSRKYLSLIGDEQVISLLHTKVYVF